MESLACWEDIVRVQGVSGDIGGEDVEGNTDGVGGRVNVEDEV